MVVVAWWCLQVVPVVVESVPVIHSSEDDTGLEKHLSRAASPSFPASQKKVSMATSLMLSQKHGQRLWMWVGGLLG